MITLPIWVQILVWAAFFFLGIHVHSWWAERRQYAEEKTVEVCGLCGNGHHVHDVNSGHCVSTSCECEVGR